MPEFTDKDYNDFANFIAKKSKNLTAPLNLEKLCSEFKKESGKPHSEEILIIRLREIRLALFQWEAYPTELDFDNDTKVKMLFALSAPVDYRFLAKLIVRREAVVEVDKYLRITKYEKKRGDGLRLNGVHISNAPEFPNDTCRNMLKLLAEISQNRKTPIEYEDFAKEFEKSTDFKLDDDDENDCYNFIKRYIHIATEFDMPTRVKMLFVSGAEVNTFFLNMLRKDADVEVDSNGRIEEYKANDGSLMLRRDDNLAAETQSEHDGNNKLFKTQVDSKKKKEKKESNCEFFRNLIKSSRQQNSKSMKSNFVVDDSSPNTSSNNSNIGRDVNDNDNKVKMPEKKNNRKTATLIPKIPVPSSGSYSSSSSKKDDNVEFDAPSNVKNVTEMVETSESSKISKKVTKLIDSTPKIQKISAEKWTVKNAENNVKANTKKASNPKKTTSTPKIDDNKGSKTSQKEKNAVKITTKVENKKRKAAENSATTSAKIAKKSAKSASKDPPKENEESQEDDLIYEGGIPPLPIPIGPKREQMEYHEEQLDSFVAYQPTEFGNSQFLADYHQDIDVKLEEMDDLEAIRDASFAPVNSTLPDENSENQRIDMTSSENILKMLRSLVLFLDAPMVQLRENSKRNLQEFLEKIDKAIEKMRVEDHKVAIDEILPVLKTSLQIVTKSAPSASSSEDCTSLQSFLWTLRTVLITLSIPALDDFQKTINENIRELDGQDKMIPVDRIRRALKTVFALAID